MCRPIGTGALAARSGDCRTRIFDPFDLSSRPGMQRISAGTMPKYNMKRIDLYVPQYDTDATITIDENHASGQPHLVVKYKKGGYEEQKDIAAAIPADWTDQDLAELIFLPVIQRPHRNWPAWEIPAADHSSPCLFRFWKGEKPPKI
jgi:hypothetical protein